jgi:hypothetical protein
MNKKAHISFEKSNQEFEDKFGCSDCKINSSTTSDNKNLSSGVIGFISAAIIAIVIGLFIFLRFF